MKGNLVTLNNFLIGPRLFDIPVYQRNYAWEEDNLEDLWEDLYYLDTSKRHYFGTVLLKYSGQTRQGPVRCFRPLRCHRRSAKAHDGNGMVRSLARARPNCVSQGPALGKMQGETAGRACKPSGEGEEPSAQGLGGGGSFFQSDAGGPASQIVSHHLHGQPGGVGGKASRGQMVQSYGTLILMRVIISHMKAIDDERFGGAASKFEGEYLKQGIHYKLNPLGETDGDFFQKFIMSPPTT